MSRSPNCEIGGGQDVETENEPGVCLRIGPGARVVRGAEGLRVCPKHGQEAELPSETIRWAMMSNDDPARLLPAGKTVKGAIAVLELIGDAPDIRRADFGPVLRARLSFRVQVGLREDWIIVLIPATGQAWDGSVLTTAGAFAHHVADCFLQFAVAGWPKSGPLKICWGPRVNPTTKLRLRPSFPPNTPMLTAGRPLAPQLKRRGLAAVTLLPIGLRLGVDGCIRQIDHMPMEVQPGCSMGLAVYKDGRSTQVCFYVPSTGAITPPQMEQVARQLTTRMSRQICKRRYR